MIYPVDKRLIEYRQKKKIREGSFLPSEYARYFKCGSCNNLVCHSVEVMPEYFFKNWNEFLSIIEFLYKSDIRAFQCPECKNEVSEANYCFAHFFISVYPYDNDLIVELISLEDDTKHYSYAFIDKKNNFNDTDNMEEIIYNLFHESRTSFQNGLNALRNKDAETALKMFRKALHYHPRWEEAIIELARCYMLLGNAAKSKRILERILRDSPDNINALLLRSWISYSQDDFDHAEEICKKVLSLDPMVADAYYYLALINLEEGNLEETVKLLLKTSEIHPEHEDASKLLYLIIKEKMNK